MSNQTLSTSLIDFGNFKLSITTRSVGDSPEVMGELTFRTIGAWLFLAGKIQREEWLLSDDEMGSVESRYIDHVNNSDFQLADAWGDARVTIWDKNGIDFHLNSDDDFQTAIDTWLAHKLGIKRALEHYKSQHPDKVIQDTPNYNAKNTYSPEEAHVEALNNTPATPKGTSRANQPQSTTAPQNSAFMSKKEAIAKLQPGDNFKMKVVQIKKRSQDGKDYYELYEPYGGKPGDFPAVSIFTDNEVSVNNGLIAALDNLGIKVGQAITADWIFNCTVGKPKEKIVKGETKVFTNIYANSF